MGWSQRCPLTRVSETGQRAMARQLYDERQHTVEQIGQLLGVSRTSVYRALQNASTVHPDHGPSTEVA